MNHKNYRYLGAISVFFVAVLLISNIASSKMVAIGSLVFDGGTLLFPLSYIFGDILTEVYGYKRSRTVIWLGFGAALFMSVFLALIGALPPAQDWPNQEAYEVILGVVPRIVLASLVAYFAGEFSNSYLLAKMKIATGGKMLWARTIGSTIVGEFIDSALFVVIAFYGLMPVSILFTIFLSNYLFKMVIEIIFTPITYRIVAFLKRSESEDYYDVDTDFNPFATGKSR